MPLFLCRWPDGDCSIVNAKSRVDALDILDEEADAQGCPLKRIDEFSIHLSIDKDGGLRLEAFGERVEDGIFETAYPVLHAALRDAPRDQDCELTASGRAQVRRAVQTERGRVKAKAGRGPKTESGKRLKAHGIDMPGAVLDRLVHKHAERTLEDFEPKSKSH